MKAKYTEIPEAYKITSLLHQKTYLVNGELKEMKLLINLPNYNQSFYPYLDTFKYFNDLNGDFRRKMS